eukprot:720880-Amphidinium_carterae.1
MWGGVLEASLLSTQYSTNVIVYDTTTGYWHQCGDSRFNPVYLLFASEHYVSMNGLGRIIIPFFPGVWGTSFGDFGTCVSSLPSRGGIVRQHNSIDRQPTLHDFYPGYETQHVGHEWGFGNGSWKVAEDHLQVSDPWMRSSGREVITLRPTSLFS